MSLHLSATSLPHTAHLPLHLLLFFFQIPRIHLVRIYFVINIMWPHLDPIQSGSSDGDFVLKTDRIWVKCSLDWTTFWNMNISIMLWISHIFALWLYDMIVFKFQGILIPWLSSVPGLRMYMKTFTSKIGGSRDKKEKVKAGEKQYKQFKKILWTCFRQEASSGIPKFYSISLRHLQIRFFFNVFDINTIKKYDQNRS